jgi:hypothetical protein
MPPKQANIVTGVDPKISYTTHTRYNTTDSLCRHYHHPQPTTTVTMDTSEPTTITPTFLRDQAAAAMLEGHGRQAYASQIDVISHVCDMVVNSTDHCPGPVLLVRPTGAGKSATRDCIGFILGGVVLTIVPLLSLGANQCDSLLRNVAERGLPVEAYHLDEYKDEAANDRIQQKLLLLPTDPDGTTFIFSSPQKLVQNLRWQKTFKTLFDRHLLRLVAVDECHLFCDFGLSFRSEFFALKSILFDHLSGVIPVLFMTATASRKTVDQLTTLTGLCFSIPRDILWPSHHTGVARRQIYVQLMINDSPLKFLRLQCTQMLTPQNHRHKIICYTNSLSRSRKYHKELQDLFDEGGIDADVVLVNGGLFKEQKFHNTNTFLGDDLEEPDIERVGHTLSFKPRVLVATSGAANAGLDDRRVTRVIRDGFPPSVRDLVQELGRAGRRPDASPSVDRVVFIISFSSFAALCFRIFLLPLLPDPDPVPSTREGGTSSASSPSVLPETLADTQTRQYQDVVGVLQLLCLGKSCFHRCIELAQLNPYVPALPETISTHLDCRHACWHCSGTAMACKDFLQPVSHVGLRQFLVEFFVKSRQPLEKVSLRGNQLCTTWISFSISTGVSFSFLVFGRTRKLQPPKEIKVLLLKLFAVGILVPKVSADLCLYCGIASDDRGSYLFNDDRYLESFPNIVTQD